MIRMLSPRRSSTSGFLRRASDWLRVLPLYVLPHHLLSAMMFSATRLRLEWWKNWQIRWFIRRFGVDMSVAEEPNPLAYPDFNSFFTRALKTGVRPVCIEADAIVSPADGELTEFGDIHDDTLLQAKGQPYSLTALLGGDIARAAAFARGQYATVYLSPRDYHRVHMPLDGTLRETVQVPGRLFSVNAASSRAVPRLFTRNERVIALFDTVFGPMAIVLVGAMFVGGIEHAWSGRLTPTPRGGVRARSYGRDDDRPPPALLKGQEMGRFNMGSTVIVLLSNPRVRWAASVATGSPVRVGQSLGRLGPGKPTKPARPAEDPADSA